MRVCGKGLASSDDAVTGAPERRVQAENDLVGVGAGGRGALEHRHRRAPRAAKALLHLPELLWGDAHLLDTATSRKAAKAEKGAAGLAGGTFVNAWQGRLAEGAALQDRPSFWWLEVGSLKQ